MVARWLGFIGLVVVLSWLSWASAQPLKEEEEEPAKKKALPKEEMEEPDSKARPVIPVPAVPLPKKEGAPAAAAPEIAELEVAGFAKEAANAKDKYPAASELLRSLIYPFDRMLGEFAGGAVWRVELLPDVELPQGELTVKIFDKTLTNFTEKKLSTGSGFKYTPFELIVIERTEDFLRTPAPGRLTRVDQLEYAAKAVACGLRFHLLAVNAGKRIGPGWRAIEQTLRERMLKYQRDRIQALIDLKEYNRADAFGMQLLNKFEDNNDVKKDVYRLQLIRTMLGLRDPTDADLMKVRASLLAYQALPGIKDEDLTKSAERRLRDRAAALVNEAKTLDNSKKTAEAITKLRQAEIIDPDLPAINELRTRLRGKVLYVAVHQLPERMSPATATTDSEKMAVELMFESLIREVPDPEMMRFRPQLAEGLPQVTPLARHFTLPQNVRFGDETGRLLTANDIRGTLELHKKLGDPNAHYSKRWGADGLEVFKTIDVINDSFKLRLTYEHGVMEPLSRATFKILPATYLQERGKAADDAEFARKPFGTGPYRYEGREPEGNGRECAVFRVNPFYSQREGKYGLPAIREIRFYVPNESSLSGDIKAGQLHIFPDPPVDWINRIRNEVGIKDIVRMHTMPNNRRIHLVAINHRQANLQDEKFRQGLSAAIDRDAIMKDVFKNKEILTHTPLVGPFPVNSWATPQAARSTKLSKPGASGLLDEGQRTNRVPQLRLSYIKDDPVNEQTCLAMKKQIEAASTAGGGKKVTINLDPLTAEQFRLRIHFEHNFDLALTTFDYRNDLYSLHGLFDPEASGRQGRNYMGYLTDEAKPTQNDRLLGKCLQELRQHRDFNTHVKNLMHDLHNQVNARVPFIPLWQLERTVAVHRELDIAFETTNESLTPDHLDPNVIFTGIELWRLK